MRKLKRLRWKYVVLTSGLLTLPLAALVGTTNTYAQTDTGASSQSVPSGPLLEAAPTMSQWTITFTYPEEKGAPSVNSSGAAKAVSPSLAGRPRTVVTTKTGDIIHEETTTVDGVKFEAWQVHGDYYIRFPGKNYWSAYEKAGTTAQGGQGRAAMMLPDNGFRDLEWIKKDAYVGKTKTSGGESLVFIPVSSNGASAENSNILQKLDSQPTVAYINAESRLPITVRLSGETRSYTFNEPGPNSTQVLPADLADEIKIGNDIRTKRGGAPAKEY